MKVMLVLPAIASGLRAAVGRMEDREAIRNADPIALRKWMESAERLIVKGLSK